MLPRILIILTILRIAAAFDPKNRKCEYSYLCLTSFIWCNDDDCNYPEGVYPQADYGGPFPALIWGQEYDLTWRSDSASTPVTIQWVFDNEEESRSSPTSSVRWETNVTDTKHFIFKPDPSMFPNALSPNVTSAAAQGLIMDQGLIRIKQFRNVTHSNGSSSITSELHEDFSNSFVVMPSWTPNFIQRARNEEVRKWKRRLGLGVGLGTGFGVVVAALVTWFAATSFGRNRTIWKSRV
ncbi:hypothetical protein K469DRAFT_743719 [Zopfia rhizophila CBS 207.26]|uniref:Uncharacterized protein n=1 Tax=Zopfia rhizophila CBS 207.26 TaxID=1314779 RepID=A0A6A6EW78_9PEZI|nr:hypothetical protein K469DRAFT_743719 [Zopfia rhizophila CBS 207.26]